MNNGKVKSAIVAMYSHIEGYPPSLNAVHFLSKQFHEIVIVHRNVMLTEWTYPENVRVVTTSRYCHHREVLKKSYFWKAKSFLEYTYLLYKQVKMVKPQWVIIYEPVAILSWYIISKITTVRPKVWYHNHDIFNGRENFFFYWAYKAQKRLFRKLEKFSLPSVERKEFFPMEHFKGDFHFIPNYPGRYLYDRFYKPLRRPDDVVRIIYQGFICAGHGLEQMLHVVREGLDNDDRKLRLILKGYFDDGFVNTFLAKADELGVRDEVELHPVTSYYNVPELASTCHIGIGIHTKTDNTNKTLGTASNKIYEYAAVGLPVILYDNDQFRKHLSSYNWAFFTDCTISNLKTVIGKILADYHHYSMEARSDFETKLNFEEFFTPAMQDI
jgi:glycosyltransferase involved in cell wall biosynthesis